MIAMANCAQTYSQSRDQLLCQLSTDRYWKHIHVHVVEKIFYQARQFMFQSLRIDCTCQPYLQENGPMI
jgi:hypothetical protein